MKVLEGAGIQAFPKRFSTDMLIFLFNIEKSCKNTLFSIDVQSLHLFTRFFTAFFKTRTSIISILHIKEKITQFKYYTKEMRVSIYSAMGCISYKL